MLKELLKEHLTDEIAKVFFYEGDELLGESGRLVGLESVYREKPDVPEMLTGVSFNVIEAEGGGEGQGENQHTVVEFVLGYETVLVLIRGWYYSYDGSHYSDWCFAKAVPAIQYLPE